MIREGGKGICDHVDGGWTEVMAVRLGALVCFLVISFFLLLCVSWLLPFV